MPSKDGGTVETAGTIVPTTVNVGANGGEVDSIVEVGDIAENGARVGGAVEETTTGFDVPSATAVGPGVPTAGWVEGAGGVANVVGLGDMAPIVGDGVFTAVGFVAAYSRRKYEETFIETA